MRRMGDMMSRSLGNRAIVLVLSCLLASACTASVLKTTRAFKKPAGDVRLVLMTPDIELSEVTAGGLFEPRADWTETGRINVIAAISEIVGKMVVTIIPYPIGEKGTPRRKDIQLVKLHTAVGGSILLHKYLQLPLPTKQDKFDWTLGADAVRLRRELGADYALFVYFRDRFTSGGRAAVIFVGLLFGVGIPGGHQVGYASLVDLRTGDVVWFNLHRSGEGDLRKKKSAAESTRSLLKEIPL